MKRKTCTETQKYKGRKEQRVGRVLTRSVFVISYSSATSLCHSTILFCLLSIVYYLQLLANTFQTSFSSSSSIASVHINFFGQPLSQLPRLPGETGVAPHRSLSPHGWRHASSQHVQTEDATQLKDIFPLASEPKSPN